MSEMGAMGADGDEKQDEGNKKNNKEKKRKDSRRKVHGIAQVKMIITRRHTSEVPLMALPGAMRDAGNVTFVTDGLRF